MREITLKQFNRCSDLAIDLLTGMAEGGYNVLDRRGMVREDLIEFFASKFAELTVEQINDIPETRVPIQMQQFMKDVSAKLDMLTMQVGTGRFQPQTTQPMRAGARKKNPYAGEFFADIFTNPPAGYEEVG